MSSQASTTVTVRDEERPAPHHSKVEQAAGSRKPTLYVVSVPETTRGGCVDTAEQDRQASLELLHRMVMG